MARVTEIQVSRSYFVTPSGALYERRQQAYEHLAAWLIVNRSTARGERVYIGPPKLVARLARWLEWADAREAPPRPQSAPQYEYRGGECATHGQVAHWRQKLGNAHWRCMLCEPHP